jgi:hypothetical protein
MQLFGYSAALPTATIANQWRLSFFLGGDRQGFRRTGASRVSHLACSCCRARHNQANNALTKIDAAQRSAKLCRSRQSSRPKGRGFERPAIHTSICVELNFRMGWMRFDHSKGGDLAAYWTSFTDEVLNAHVTSFPPTGEGDGRPNSSQKRVELNPVTLQWRRGRIRGCSFNVALSRRL